MGNNNNTTCCIFDKRFSPIPATDTVTTVFFSFSKRARNITVSPLLFFFFLFLFLSSEEVSNVSYKIDRAHSFNPFIMISSVQRDIVMRALKY